MGFDRLSGLVFGMLCSVAVSTALPAGPPSEMYRAEYSGPPPQGGGSSAGPRRETATSGETVVMRSPSASVVVSARQLAHRPDRSAVRLFRNAQKLRKQGQDHSAVAALRRAVVIDPDYVEAAHLLGLMLIAGSQFDEGIERLERAASLDASNPALLCGLAYAYGLRGEAALMRTTLDRAARAGGRSCGGSSRAGH